MWAPSPGSRRSQARGWAALPCIRCLWWLRTCPASPATRRSWGRSCECPDRRFVRPGSLSSSPRAVRAVEPGPGPAESRPDLGSHPGPLLQPRPQRVELCPPQERSSPQPQNPCALEGGGLQGWRGSGTERRWSWIGVVPQCSGEQSFRERRGETRWGEAEAGGRRAPAKQCRGWPGTRKPEGDRGWILPQSRLSPGLQSGESAAASWSRPAAVTLRGSRRTPMRCPWSERFRVTLTAGAPGGLQPPRLRPGTGTPHSPCALCCGDNPGQVTRHWQRPGRCETSVGKPHGPAQDVSKGLGWVSV